MHLHSNYTTYEYDSNIILEILKVQLRTLKPIHPKKSQEGYNKKKNLIAQTL